MSFTAAVWQTSFRTPRCWSTCNGARRQLLAQRTCNPCCDLARVCPQDVFQRRGLANLFWDPMALDEYMQQRQAAASCSKNVQPLLYVCIFVTLPGSVHRMSFSAAVWQTSFGPHGATGHGRRRLSSAARRSAGHSRRRLRSAARRSTGRSTGLSSAVSVLQCLPGGAAVWQTSFGTPRRWTSTCNGQALKEHATFVVCLHLRDLARVYPQDVFQRRGLANLLRDPTALDEYLQRRQAAASCSKNVQPCLYVCIFVTSPGSARRMSFSAAVWQTSFRTLRCWTSTCNGARRQLLAQRTCGLSTGCLSAPWSGKPLLGPHGAGRVPATAPGGSFFLEERATLVVCLHLRDLARVCPQDVFQRRGLARRLGGLQGTAGGGSARRLGGLRGGLRGSARRCPFCSACLEVPRSGKPLLGPHGAGRVPATAPGGSFLLKERATLVVCLHLRDLARVCPQDVFQRLGLARAPRRWMSTCNGARWQLQGQGSSDLRKPYKQGVY